MLFQAAADFLPTINAAAAAMLAYVPDAVTAGALLVCMGRALRAVLRRLLPGLDWYGERRGPGHGRHWSWEYDQRHRSLELWAGGAYVCIDLPQWKPAAGQQPA